MRSLRRIAISIASTAVVLMLLPVSPAAAGGCYRLGCDGQDPSAMGCPAITVKEFLSNGVRYELRHSRECGSVWTRATAPAGYLAGYDNAQIRKYWCSAASSSCRSGVLVRQIDDGVRWTPMYGTGNGRRFRACRNNRGSDGAGDPIVCTAPVYFNYS